MKLFEPLTTITQLGFLLMLATSTLTFAEDRQQMEEDSQQFWQEWNDYVSTLIQSGLERPDPLESLNRKIFAFNDVADKYVLSPVARGYQAVTPDSLERGIGNMFSNLLEITTVINDVLQLKFGQAASDTGRFLINSTVGLAGLFDVASPLGLEKHEEDFGQTLGYWGVVSGPYLVVPFLGPYTLRDSVGGFADVFSDYITKLDHIPTRNQLWMLRNVDDRGGLFAAEELITGDRYSFIRDAYLQRREYLVNDGVVTDNFGEAVDGGWNDDEWLEE
ncbi:MAG: phospholipid-binding lipoprotein MlaA [Oceanicoccus sp.]|jgi:phospholipid-binding lipoprotein MlaA